MRAQAEAAAHSESQSITVAQVSAVPRDDRLKKIEQGIGELESRAAEIANKAPDYGSGAPDAATALRSAYNEGRIRAGTGDQFK